MSARDASQVELSQRQAYRDAIAPARMLSLAMLFGLFVCLVLAAIFVARHG